MTFSNLDRARFWRNVRKHRKGLQCWTWRGERQTQKNLPYGLFNYRDASGRRRRMTAHKAAWIMTHGEVPTGKELGHTCHNQRCIRPDHLKPITHAENVAESNDDRTTAPGAPKIGRDLRYSPESRH